MCRLCAAPGHLTPSATRTDPNPTFNLKRKATPSLSHYALLRVDAAWPRLGRAFRTAPVSRQTNPNRVWHSPRFHSRPATLLRPPFCPFHRSALFLPAAAQVKKETSRKRQKGKKHEIRRSQQHEPKRPWISSLQHWSPVTVKSSPHTSEQWRSFTPTASATSCSSHVRSPMLPTLPDFGHGTRLAASLNGEKKAFSFSPRWSENEARRM